MTRYKENNYCSECGDKLHDDLCWNCDHEQVSQIQEEERLRHDEENERRQDQQDAGKRYDQWLEDEAMRHMEEE